jgi:hypothetical protein
MAAAGPALAESLGGSEFALEVFELLVGESERRMGDEHHALSGRAMQ